MSDIKNSLKDNLKISYFRVFSGVAGIVSSILWFKKANTKGKKVLSVISGLASVLDLVLEVEKDFKPIEVEDDAD